MASSSVTGTWRLIAYKTKKADGQEELPYGQEVDGYITYTEQGRMSAILRLGNGVPPTGQFAAYAGSYEINGDNIVHHADISLAGQGRKFDLVRSFRFDGNRLSLTPAETLRWEAAGTVVTLVWERV